MKKKNKEIKPIEILGTFRIKMYEGMDEYIISAAKVDDGAVRFADSWSEKIIEKRIQWEDEMLLRSASDELLKRCIQALLKELNRRKLKDGK